MPGFFGHGASVLWGSIPIDGCLDIPIPEEDREDVEITDQNSNFRREYVPGLIDTSEWELSCRMIPEDTGQQELIAAAGDPDTIETVTIRGPDHKIPRPVYTFSAYVKRIGGTFFWEGQAAGQTFVFKITGAIEKSLLSS